MASHKPGTNKYGQVSPKNFAKGPKRRAQRAANRRARGLKTDKFDARTSESVGDKAQAASNKSYQRTQARGGLTKPQQNRRIGKGAQKPSDYLSMRPELVLPDPRAEITVQNPAAPVNPNIPTPPAQMDFGAMEDFIRQMMGGKAGRVA